jgi:outer membrane cobalamin receptor
MKKFHSLFFLLLLFPASLFAQQAVLMGLVRDGATKEPMPGVSVSVSTSVGVVTDSAGRYSLNLEPGTYEVMFRFIGFTTQYKKVVIAPSQAQILNVDLLSETTVLNTVVVSAGKFEQQLDEVTVSMQVLKPELIENTNSITMDAAVEQVPGVTVIDGQANIRAGSGYSYGAGSRVQVLIDEMPALAADANDVKWNFIPVENISQVEVIKGASSALFGSSAMNGVINIRTIYPGSKPVTKISAYTGWYGDTRRSELQWWDDSFQAGKLDLVFTGNTFKDEGYRLGETEQRYRLTANTRYRFKTEGLSAGLNANVTASSGGLFFIWQDDSSGAYIPQGGMVDSTTTISEYETTRTSIDPYVTYANRTGSTHKLRGRYFRSANRNNTSQESFATMYYGEYIYQKKFGDHLTLTGGLVEQYSVVESELYDDHTSNNIGVYAQADAKLGRFNLSLGGRLESNQIDGENEENIPVIRSGVNYRVFEYTTVRASYGQGYRYPSIAEKYVSTNVGDIVIYPNDSLESETGWTAEIGMMQGFRIGSWFGYFDVAAFISEYQDMMEFTFGQYGGFNAPLFGLGFKSQNIGNTRITGIDVAVTGQGSIGKMPVSLLAGYTYADPIQQDFNAAVDTLKNSADYNVLKYRYRHTFKGDIELNPGKFMLGLSTRYTSFMENIDKVFETLIPGVEHYREKHYYGDWVFDLRTGIRVNDLFRFSFIVKNLFNHEYASRPADMQPSRNYTMQFNFTF